MCFRLEKLHVDGIDVWNVPYLRTSGIRKVGYLLMTRQNMQINVHVMSLEPRRGAQEHPFEHLRQAMDSIVGAAMMQRDNQTVLDGQWNRGIETISQRGPLMGNGRIESTSLLK